MTIVQDTACAEPPDPALPPYTAAQRLSGHLSLAGADAMAEMVQRWIAILSRAHPDITWQFETGAPATSPKGLAAGTADIGYNGRTLWPTEMAVIKEAQGAMPRSFRVAAGTYDNKTTTLTTGVFVHGDNPLQSITLAQLDAVFSSTRLRGAAAPVKVWGQLGLPGEWTKAQVHPYTTLHQTGPMNDMKLAILRGGDWRSDVRVIGVFKEDALMIAALCQDRAGIGLAGIGYAVPGVRLVAVAEDETSPAYLPTRENVVRGAYPLIRMQYFHINGTPGKRLNPLIREFLELVWSRDGQQVAHECGFLTLTPEMVLLERAKLD